MRHLRRAWPKVDIILRADSHHTRPAVMDWCEIHALSHIPGLGPNSKLNEQFAPAIRAAAQKDEIHRRNGRADEVVCVHASGDYQAGTWSRPRRVVCRVYHGPPGSDTRYIVTSFREAGARYLYDKKNRIRPEVPCLGRPATITRPSTPPPPEPLALVNDSG